MAADEATPQHLEYGLTDAYMLIAHVQLCLSIAKNKPIAIKKFVKLLFYMLFYAILWDITLKLNWQDGIATFWLKPFYRTPVTPYKQPYH